MISIEECKKIRADLLNKFKDLQFEEESHTYTLHGKVLKSVSSLIKYFEVPFDDEVQAASYAKKYGFTTEQVLSSWRGHAKMATDRGHKVHTFGENWINYQFFEQDKELPIPKCLQELGIVQFWQDNILKYDYLYPLIMELQMFSPKYYYSGTADILILDRRNGSLLCLDYKTNADIFKKSYSNLIVDGFTDYPNTAYSHYVLQLSFYSIMLMEMGYTVSNRTLIWLNKDEQNKKLYRLYKLPFVGEWLYPWLEAGVFLK